MPADAQIAAASLIARLGRIELEQKRLGMISHAEGVRLAITEVIRMAREQAPKAADAAGEPSPMLVRSG